MNLFFFGVYPYICLVIMTLGLLFRYMATPGEWNARSSNLFAKKSLALGSYLFHYAIILAFFGHLFGLCTPVYVFNALGFTTSIHTVVASFFGKILAIGVFLGALILLVRRFASRDVLASTVTMDIVVLLFIMFQACTGGAQDFIGGFNVFDTVGPWIRGVLACQPNPQLMANVPVYIKIHVVCGFAIFAMIPFSRLVHFFSFPWTWCIRPLISYRKRYENL